MPVLNVRNVSPQLLNRIKSIAALKGISVRDYVLLAIEKAFENDKELIHAAVANSPSGEWPQKGKKPSPLDAPSGITSKPAIEGHLKTGQRTAFRD